MSKATKKKAAKKNPIAKEPKVLSGGTFEDILAISTTRAKAKPKKKKRQGKEKK